MKVHCPIRLVWRNRLGYNEVMTNNYLRHPAYADYPVVGVSWVQAVEFSNWRTDRVNELILEEEGITTRNARYEVSPGKHFSTETYLNAPTQTYGGNDSITRGGKRSEGLLKEIKTVPIFTFNEKMDYYYPITDFLPKQNGNMPHLGCRI